MKSGSGPGDGQRAFREDLHWFNPVREMTMFTFGNGPKRDA